MVPGGRSRAAQLLLVSLVVTAVSPHSARAEAAPSPALREPLTLDAALVLLRERGLDVLAADAAVAGAEGDLRTAGAVANPTLSGSYGRSHPYGHCVDAAGNATPCELLPDAALAVGLSDNAALSDAISGKRGLRKDVAHAALAAARLQRDDALRNLEAQVKTAFVQVVAARATLVFTEDVAAAQARTVTLSKARLDAGSISEADLARIETARLEADQAVDQARAQLRGAKVALAFLLGVRGAVPDYDVVAGPYERAAAPAGLEGASRDTLVARALEKRPDVVAARRGQDRADSALALARRQRVPDVTLSLNYTQQGTTNQAITPPTFTAGLSLPLPIFDQQQGPIARAEADRRAQELAVAKAEATVTSDVEAAWASYVAARALVNRMEGRLLERAQTARDLVEVQYKKGAASLLDLLDAERTFIATRIEYLQDVAGYWGAVFRLEQATGESLR
jgi:cobalt-zinc-cadmium efflux system outer membrane protein